MENCFRCEVRRAVSQFAVKRFEALARKVVYRLQRFPATGIYHRDPPDRTLWDEYCHEGQVGNDPQIEWAWESSLPGFYRDIVESVPAEEGCLLSIWSDRASYVDADREESTFVDQDYIGERVVQALAGLAGARDMSKFD
jgi:hypothetical protein